MWVGIGIGAAIGVPAGIGIGYVFYRMALYDLIDWIFGGY